MSTSVARQSLALASSALTCAVVLWVYDLFHRFDWGQPFTKLLCFATLGGLVLWLNRPPTSLTGGETTEDNAARAWIEALVLAGVGAFFVRSYLWYFSSFAPLCYGSPVSHFWSCWLFAAGMPSRQPVVSPCGWQSTIGSLDHPLHLSRFSGSS